MRADRAAPVLVLALFGALTACREEPPAAVEPGRLTRARAGPARALLALSPSESPAGVVFQKQPTGDAAIAAIGAGFAPGDVLVWSGRPLRTTYAHSRLLTAIVPPDLIATPGTYEVAVENPDPSRTRLTASFRVLPAP